MFTPYFRYPRRHYRSTEGLFNGTHCQFEVYLQTEWIKILDRFALRERMVIVKAEQIEEVVPVVVEAGPQDVDLCLADGGGALVPHVVGVNHDLANILLKLVARRQRLRDVVGDLWRGGQAGHTEVCFHPDGDGEDDVVVLVVCPGLGVAGPGGDGEPELGDRLVHLLGLRLQDGRSDHLKPSCMY